MRDPHVVRLHYAVTSDEGTSYQDPPPVEVVDVLGTFRVTDGQLAVEPAEHYANEAAARAAIEPYLQAWEIATDLNGQFGALRFEFQNAEVVDRQPSPVGHILPAATARWVVNGSSATLHLTRCAYPTPPTDFQATRDVTLAYRRWRAYRAGREPLLAMGYFVLTVVEGSRSRRQAGSLFCIDYAVLDTLGKFTSIRGDESSARKAPGDGIYSELTPAEKRWLEAAVPMIIRRLGAHAAGASLQSITMQDLPDLL